MFTTIDFDSAPARRLEGKSIRDRVQSIRSRVDDQIPCVVQFLGQRPNQGHSPTDSARPTARRSLASHQAAKPLRTRHIRDEWIASSKQSAVSGRIGSAWELGVGVRPGSAWRAEVCGRSGSAWELGVGVRHRSASPSDVRRGYAPPPQCTKTMGSAHGSGSAPQSSKRHASKSFSVTNRDVLQPTPENIFDPRTSWNDVRANLPGRAGAVSLGSKVFGGSAPAQLIKLILQPVCAPVAGTIVLWVSNTENDLFRHKATGASSYHVGFLSYALPHLQNRMELCRLGDFYPNPPTYGLMARHDSYAGTFGRGAGVYGPYDGAGGFAAYPRTGTYARGGAVDGPYSEQQRQPRVATIEDP